MPWFMAPIGPTIAVSIVVAFAIATLLCRPRRFNEPASLRRKLPSPRETLLPYLSGEKAAMLPYPPSLLPGARDVETSYGVMRVYEWGPENGRKVLMVHGDTTPGPMFGPIAGKLVGRGCRVMILDLWGRGYSDTPLNVPHDSRLFTTQIFFALASSPISWTGTASGGFSMIGFSLGGGITMSFAAHFPNLVNSIILLAPAGILRQMPEDYTQFAMRYASFMPKKYLRRVVGKVLGVKVSNEVTAKQEEWGDDNAGPKVPQRAVRVEELALNIPNIVQWQFDHHKGFCHSFVNTIMFGPIMNQESDWRKACDIIRGRETLSSNSKSQSGLRNSKLLVIFGDRDTIVDKDHVSKDLCSMLGSREYIEIQTVPGGHGFPVPACDQVVNQICDYWHI